jgi:hypothetical protein
MIRARRGMRKKQANPRIKSPSRKERTLKKLIPTWSAIKTTIESPKKNGFFRSNKGLPGLDYLLNH